MRNTYTKEGRVWFDDQLCEMADLILGTEGIMYIYLKKRDRAWIRKIGDDGMRFAVMSMTDIQICIIELLLFEGRPVADILRRLNISTTQLRTEIRNMRKTLITVM